MAGLTKKQALDVTEQVMANHGLKMWQKGLIIGLAMGWHLMPDPVLGQIDDISAYVPAFIATSARFNIWVERQRLAFEVWREARQERRAMSRAQRIG